MTNTLHRFQKPDDPKDDYIVFTMVTRGVNDIGSLEKAREFLKAAIKHNPININAHSGQGPMYRPEKKLNPFKLYVLGRKEKASPEQMLEEMEQAGGQVLVVFDNKPATEAFLKEIKEMDLGLSINVSSLVDDILEMAPRTGIVPHSMNYALGFRGNRYRLPERNVLELTTLCGHGLISNNFARKMINMVREKRVTPEKAAGYMSKFCVCGAFNTTRAVRILNRAIYADTASG
jgi:hypothetical protein